MADTRGARFLTLLNSKRNDHAVASLRSPKDTTAFEYGRVSGFYQGLEIAEQTYRDVISEEERSKHERNNQTRPTED